MTKAHPSYTLYWERLSGAIGPQVLLEEIGAAYARSRSIWRPANTVEAPTG